MTDETPNTEQIVLAAADKVERRLLHVPFADLLDARSREALLELARNVV